MNEETYAAYCKAAKAYKALNDYKFQGDIIEFRIQCEHLHKEYNKAAKEYQEAKAKNKGQRQ